MEARLRVLAICAVAIELLHPIQKCVRMHDVLNGKATAFLFWHIFQDVCGEFTRRTQPPAKMPKGFAAIEANMCRRCRQHTRSYKHTHTRARIDTHDKATQTPSPPPHPSRQPSPAIIRRLQTHPRSALSNRWYILTITANKSLLPPVPCPFA